MDHHMRKRARRVASWGMYFLVGGLAVLVIVLVCADLLRQDGDSERGLAVPQTGEVPMNSSELLESEDLSGGAMNDAEIRQQADEVERRLAALRAAGYPTSSRELDESEAIPEGAMNAAEVYFQASDAFVSVSDEFRVPLLGDGRLPDIGVPLSQRVFLATQRYLWSNGKCLSLLHEAGTIDHCQFARNDQGDMVSFRERACTQLLVLAAVHRAQRNDSDGAIASIKDVLRLCQLLPDHEHLLSHVQKTAGVGLAMTGVEWILNATPLTERQLSDLDQACAQVKTGTATY